MGFKEKDFRVETGGNADGSTGVYLRNIDRWDDFDMVLGFLRQESGCGLLVKQDHIYQRRAELEWRGFPFDLRYDCVLGIFLFTDKDELVPVIEALGAKVMDSVKGKLAAMGLLERESALRRLFFRE
ncbi:MAG: hypothetical protein FWG23_05885 [Eggerthellaceae bacterium]|jgi:hypothetical protein|nr:hypothetical protein [Eggerthellaceae bacterium]MDR2715672.1 hypothetical protein [Coriobacteriaceae bacterium]